MVKKRSVDQRCQSSCLLKGEIVHCLFPSRNVISSTVLCAAQCSGLPLLLCFFVCAFLLLLCMCVATHTLLVSSEGQCHLELSRKALVPNTRARIIQLVLSQFMWQKYSAKSNLF